MKNIENYLPDLNKEHESDKILDDISIYRDPNNSSIIIVTQKSCETWGPNCKKQDTNNYP